MWATIGYDQTQKFLARGLDAGHVAHAYLITGPAHVGKTTLALDLARALNCLQPEPPCGECLSCLKIAHGTHPDVRVVEPGQVKDGEGTASEGAGGGDIITIGQIRALQHESSLSPFEGRRRVYILSDFEKASTEAANCLLKTLEEPPASVILVLTAQAMGSLLPTIVSRCQVLRLHRLPVAKVREALVKRWKVEPERAGMLANLSMGRLGWAVQASQDERLFAQRRADLDELLSALGEDRLARMDRALKLSQRRDALPDVLRQWFVWWRDVLLFQMDCPQLAINSDRKGVLQAHAETYDSKCILRCLGQVRSTYRWLQQNANARLAMEALLLQLPEAT